MAPGGLLGQFWTGSIVIAPSGWDHSFVTELGSLVALAWSSSLCCPLCCVGLPVIPFFQGTIFTQY